MVEQAQAELIYAYYVNSQFEMSQSAAERCHQPASQNTVLDMLIMKGLASFTDDSGLFTRYFQSDLAKEEAVVMAQQSFDELSDFISRYPNSEYVPHAKQRMIYLRNLLAEHEIYVADFYMKKRSLLGTW